MGITGLTAKKKRLSNSGFTLIELLISVIIISIFGTAGISAFRQQIKMAHATEVVTQLSAASRKLLVTTQNRTEITEASCLDNAGLLNSKRFTYSCSQREGAAGVFDISAKPLGNIGVGGILSFGAGRDKICWDTCDAIGSGDEAVLAKPHLSLNGGCTSLTRNERNYECNCRNQDHQTCGWEKFDCICPRGWRCRCKKRFACRTTTREVCDNCTDIYYTNEKGLILDQ